MSADTITARVTDIRQEALEIKSFDLVDASGAQLPRFAPGSHIDVHIEESLVRQYSLCGELGEGHAYRIAVKREPQSRGGSQALHERLRVGDLLRISRPRNYFALSESQTHSVLIAGGIGITPLLSMARHLDAADQSFELAYFSRSSGHAAFRGWLSQPRFASNVAFYDGLTPEAVQDRLHKLLLQRADGAHVYICGPRPFMDMATQTAARTWPSDSIHLEYFAADAESLSAPTDHFTLRLARSGTDCIVPADKSILAALSEQGVFLETACEQGVCGTCITRVLSGVPDHRDVFLTAAERAAGDKILPCVSRAKSDVIVLDL